MNPSELLPPPPPSEDAVNLSVEIPASVSFKLKIVLLHMEASGNKVSKRKFVGDALEKALNEFDQNWKGV